MKVLKIDEKMEKLLISIFDVTLKSSGLNALEAINYIRSKIQEEPKESVEDNG